MADIRYEVDTPSRELYGSLLSLRRQLREFLRDPTHSYGSYIQTVLPCTGEALNIIDEELEIVGDRASYSFVKPVRCEEFYPYMKKSERDRLLHIFILETIVKALKISALFLSHERLPHFTEEFEIMLYRRRTGATLLATYFHSRHLLRTTGTLPTHTTPEHQIYSRLPRPAFAEVFRQLFR